MLWQILLILAFALNLGLLWSIKAVWYQRLGSLLFALLPLTTVFFDQPKFALDYSWWIIAGGVAIALGVALMVWTKLARGQKMTSLGECPADFCQNGPYQYVRHPMYLSLVFIFVGWWWVWSAVYSFYFGMFILALVWIQAYLEEKLVMLPKFGSQYEQYRRQTGMFWVK